MGHSRLATLPDTRPWNRVVQLIADGETAATIAGATSAAAVAGLERGKSDTGLGHVIYLLAHTVLAARQDDFAGQLARHGVNVPDEPGLFDLTAAFAAAVRTWHSERRIRQTDLGEMAELSAVEAITRCVGDECEGLFQTDDAVQRATREFSTRKGFSTLAHEFFSRFTQRFLLYHLGRELPLHVGGNGRFADPPAQTVFTDDLEIHSREAAVIVKAFAGEWYSKAHFEGGITERQAKGFAAHCLTKLGWELERRGERDG
jgi:hypothetical protein